MTPENGSFQELFFTGWENTFLIFILATALINIVLILALRAAKYSTGSACNKCFRAVLAQANRIFFVRYTNPSDMYCNLNNSNSYLHYTISFSRFQPLRRDSLHHSCPRIPFSFAFSWAYRKDCLLLYQRQPCHSKEHFHLHPRHHLCSRHHESQSVNSGRLRHTIYGSQGRQNIFWQNYRSR